MNEINEPIFPSNLFTWDMERKIASSDVLIIFEHFKDSKKRIVLDIDNIMWIKSVDTNSIITCKLMDKSKTKYSYQVQEGPIEMVDWLIDIQTKFDSA